MSSSTIEFTIVGEPASKANSRKLVTIGGKPRFIKSAKARSYLSSFQMQCPRLDCLMLDDLRVDITIHYKTRRPDLDESLILDAMEGFIYKNDRQVKEKHIYHALDKENPRAVIKVSLRER